MTTLNGWLHINGFNADSATTEACLNQIRREGLFVNRTVMNTILLIQIASCHNHFSGLERSVIDFFRDMSKMVDSESFGLLYIYDEEGRSGCDDGFQVFRLAKNEVTCVKDPFFSPYSEKIADYSEDDR